MKRLTLLAALVSAPALFAVDALAQTAAERYEEARQMYRDRDYAGAIPIILASIQQDPGIPEYYLGAARTYFRLENYDTAVLFYDIYIDYFGSRLPQSTPANNSVARAREERESANVERANPEAPVPDPPGQAEARAALLNRIAEGTGLTANNGGAVAIYDALMRSGYARPDLLQLRIQLMDCLLAEAQLFVPPDRAMLPSLSLDQWTTQRERMRRHQSLLPAATLGEEAVGRPVAANQADPARAMLHMAEGQIQFINGNWDRAAENFQLALIADGAMLPAHMGLLNAWYHTQRGRTPEVDAALADFRELIEQNDPDALEMFALYGAAFAARSGERELAVRTIGEMLGLPVE
jgi:tetratricopeptide (TPR) repeat protein